MPKHGTKLKSTKDMASLNSTRLMSILLGWILSKDSHTDIFCTIFTVLLTLGNQQRNANKQQMMKTAICYKVREEIGTSLVCLVFPQGLCVLWPFVEMLSCSCFLKIL